MNKCEFDANLVCVYCGWQATKRRTYRQCTAGDERPSIFSRISTYGVELANWLRAGRPTRSVDRITSLLAICQGCDKYDSEHKRCNKCGCAVNASTRGWENKLAMATTRCPLEPPRWDVEQSEADERLRVGFVVPHLVVGGVERWLCDLAELLPSANVNVAGIAFLGGERMYEPIMGQEIARHCPLIGTLDRPEIHRVPRAAEAVYAVAAGADVLVVWGLATDQLEAVRATGKPCVGVIHGEGAWHVGADWIERWVAVSETARKHGPPATVIHNGVNLRRLDVTKDRGNVRREAGIPPHAKVIVSIGRVSAEKRLELAAAALKHLPTNVYLWVIGHGGEQDAIKVAAGDQAARVICSPPRHDIGNALAASNCAVLLSRDEGYCLAAVEALMAGVPLISTPVGIIPSLPGVERLPLDPTPMEIAAAIRATPRDELAVERQSARSIIHRHHSAEAMAARWATYLAGVHA